MTCSGRGCGAMRCPRTPGGRAGARSGSARRWPACGAAAGAAGAAKEAGSLAEAAAGRPRPGNSPGGVTVQLAAMKVERARAAQQAKVDAWRARAAAGTPRSGPRPADPDSYIRVRQAAAQLEKAQARAGQAERKAAEKAARRRGPGEPVRHITD